MADNPFALQNGEDNNARYERFNRDYHSADRDSVLNDARNGTGAFGAQQQTAQANPFDYEQAKNSWMDKRYGTGKEGATAWAAANGINYDGSDTIQLPNGGGYIDIISNFGGGAGNGQAMGNTWTPAGGNGSNPGGQGSGGYGSGSGGAGYGSQDPRWTALYDELLQRSQQSLNIDPNDPIIRNQTEAYNAQNERARRQFLSSQAEKSSPYATGAQQGQERMSAERVGQGNAAFQSELMGRELSSRRDEIQNALTQRGAMLTEQQRLSLQHELSLLNDATQRYGIDAGSQQASDRLGFDIGRSDMDYWLRSQGL